MSYRLEIGLALLLASAVGVAVFAAHRTPKPQERDFRASTFLSGPDGSQALYRVMVRLGRPVERRRTALFALVDDTSQRRASPPALVVVLDPPMGLESAELDQVVRFVQHGGAVLAAGYGGGITRCAGWRLHPEGALDDSVAVRPPLDVGAQHAAPLRLPGAARVFAPRPRGGAKRHADRGDRRSARRAAAALRRRRDDHARVRRRLVSQSGVARQRRALPRHAAADSPPPRGTARPRRVGRIPSRIRAGVAVDGGRHLGLDGPLARRLGDLPAHGGGAGVVGRDGGAVRSAPVGDRAPSPLSPRAPRGARRRPRERLRFGHRRSAHRRRTAAPVEPRRPCGQLRPESVARDAGAGHDDSPRARLGAPPATLDHATRWRVPGTRARRRPSRGGRVGGTSPAHDARSILDAMRQVVLGQEAATREVLVCLLARGHILLEGVPGTAKTLLVRTLALALEAKFVRIQFTPDLMPADITGITLLTGAHEFTFRQGPIFADLVLADEINRAPAKTQAALLEAMQERTVTVDGQSHPL